MEVATIITNSIETCTLFDDYIFSTPDLCLISKDADTAYFNDEHDDKKRIFYHYQLNDAQYEFSYNYSDQEVTFIRNFFGSESIYMFDISYRPEELLQEVLTAFKRYVKVHNELLLSGILISHTFDGIKYLQKDY